MEYWSNGTKEGIFPSSILQYSNTPVLQYSWRHVDLGFSCQGNTFNPRISFLQQCRPILPGEAHDIYGTHDGKNRTPYL